MNLAEALDQLGRVHGHTQEALRAAFGPVLGEAVVVLAADEPTAWASAELRRRHYGRRHSELSLADCVALATASAAGAIATADPPLAAAARAEGIDVIALPDSGGRAP